jgi:hypothetical protein
MYVHWAQFAATSTLFCPDKYVILTLRLQTGYKTYPSLEFPWINLAGTEKQSTNFSICSLKSHWHNIIIIQHIYCLRVVCYFNPIGPFDTHISIECQWRTEGSLEGFKTSPKFSQSWAEFPVPWKIIHKNVIRIRVSFICKSNGTPFFLPSVLNWICWTPPPPTPEKNSCVRHCRMSEIRVLPKRTT